VHYKELSDCFWCYIVITCYLQVTIFRNSTSHLIKMLFPGFKTETGNADLFANACVTCNRRLPKIDENLLKNSLRSASAAQKN